MNKCEGPAERLNLRQRVTLDLRVVKIIQVVESPDAVAVMEEAFADVRADESRAACDQVQFAHDISRVVIGDW
jgi:hypothetical protein